MAIYSEFSHETWWFSIVMLVYQRVTSSTIIPLFLHHIQPLGPMDLARASRSGTTPSGRATSWGRCWENWRSTWSWAWKIYGFMMVYDGLWWFMMVYDGLWWFMMVYGCKKMGQKVEKPIWNFTEVKMRTLPSNIEKDVEKNRESRSCSNGKPRVSTSMLVYLRVTDQTSGIFMGFDMI